MKITDIIHNLAITRTASLAEKEKINAIFLLEKEMHHIMEHTQDPMAAILRLSWHRTEVNQHRANNPTPHLEFIYKYHAEFLPLLDRYFTAWEIALERKANITADDLINNFIMPRANIWSILSEQTSQLMSAFYLSNFLYNLPAMKKNGWNINSKQTMNIHKELLDTLVILHNSVTPTTNSSKIHNIIAWTNYRLIKHLLKYKDSDKFQPPQLNPGLVQLYLLINTFRTPPLITTQD